MNEEIKEKKKKNSNKELEEANNKIKDLEDALLRSKAEMINYRKRKDDEVMAMIKYSNEDLISQLLEILDSLESCIKMDDNKLSEDISNYLAGVKMIYCNLINVLEGYGVKEIDGINKPFDPKYHQAVLTEKSNIEPGMVTEVLRKGYLYKDKVIRPAMVKVSE